MKKILTVLLLLAGFQSFSQTEAEDYSEGVLQFSGMVVDNDSLMPIPYATVVLKRSGFGTISDRNGFFSVAALDGDTVIFSAIGYKKEELALTSSEDQKSMSIVQSMVRDTINLPEAVINLYPTRESFAREFLALNLNDDDLLRSQRNLDPRVLYAFADVIGADGSENRSYFYQQEQLRQSNVNGNGTISLLNPFNWARFISSLNKQ